MTDLLWLWVSLSFIAGFAAGVVISVGCVAVTFGYAQGRALAR